jgi:pimeloyl-ACP methyl ester carboxylesterase
MGGKSRREKRMPQFEMVEVRPGIRIAVEIRRPRNSKYPHPGFMWLGGFKSDMTGTKATYLRDLAWWGGRPFIRFDYSGHGLSEGRFEDGTISLWLEEAEMVLNLAEGWPMILIGSSMGGYLALLLAKRRTNSIKGLVLVAPAADMTHALMEPQIASHEEARTAIARDGVWLRPSQYGEPYPITRKLIEDGRKHLILPSGVDVDCPVRILHGDEDPDVPWEHGLTTYRAIQSADIQFTLIKGGDHRLSRDNDMLAIYNAAERLAIGAAIDDEPPEFGSEPLEP